MACRVSELVVDSRAPEVLAVVRADGLDYRVLSRQDGAVEIGTDAWFGGPAPTLVFGPVAGRIRG
jgi:hypothetical protein